MMNAKQALAQARRIWGKRAAVEDIKIVTSPEIRDKAQQEWLTFKHLKPSERPKNWQSIDSARLRYRFSVGSIDNVAGMFNVFHVRGYGDTWEQAFERAQRSIA